MTKREQIKHLKNKITSAEKMIVDYEFAKFQKGISREQIRLEYDNNKSKKETINNQIKEEEKKEKEVIDLKKDEINRLKDSIVRLDDAIKQGEEKMKGLDAEVYGIKPCAEHPNGVNGINDFIATLHDLIEMANLYIKKIK